MRAVHWVRTRQEEREVFYWLSFIAYEHRDHSINNRLYLLYLILFGSAWIFVTLTLFASGGAAILRLLNPANPDQAAISLEVLLLGLWFLFTLWQSLKCSPVVFSEQDAMLISQMPVDRRLVTMRWFLMPWLKSAILFWLLVITLGFSLAEITLPGVIGASRFLEYAGYGFRAWLTIIPVHLTLFSLRWVVGIYRLQKNLERHWLVWPVITATILFFAFLLTLLFDRKIPFLIPWIGIVKLFVLPIQAGFVDGNVIVSLLTTWFFAFAMFGMMCWVSGGFSLSRAAHETQEDEAQKSAFRYGFNSYAEGLKTQQRLGVERLSSRLPAFTGAGVFIWKDILQSLRTFRLPVLFDWFMIFSIMLSLSLLPDFGSRTFAMVIWVLRIGKVSVVRIRNDLSYWPLVRQLPISPNKFLLFDLGSTYLLAVMTSLAGLVTNSIITKAPVDGFVWLVPGVIAAVAGMAIFDVIRRSRSDLLLDGSVPEISAGGILLGLLFMTIPLLIFNLLSGLIGYTFSILSSLGLGVLAFFLAVRFYRNLNAS